eukprot:TRINITY_DN38350_c0_g1_i1.p1 TRINITY_DN38350_c0_g1~~TRINITY_DN38350_c0_g1_i1.p1  ORF type:complete len:1258 (+),score=176.67 TRINITY_DN38350_c0_g1_i1:68-3841(+)
MQPSHVQGAAKLRRRSDLSPPISSTIEGAGSKKRTNVRKASSASQPIGRLSTRSSAESNRITTSSAESLASLLALEHGSPPPLGNNDGVNPNSASYSNPNEGPSTCELRQGPGASQEFYVISYPINSACERRQQSSTSAMDMSKGDRSEGPARQRKNNACRRDNGSNPKRVEGIRKVVGGQEGENDRSLNLADALLTLGAPVLATVFAVAIGWLALGRLKQNKEGEENAKRKEESHGHTASASEGLNHVVQRKLVGSAENIEVKKKAELVQVDCGHLKDLGRDNAILVCVGTEERKAEEILTSNVGGKPSEPVDFGEDCVPIRESGACSCHVLDWPRRRLDGQDGSRAGEHIGRDCAECGTLQNCTGGRGKVGSGRFNADVALVHNSVVSNNGETAPGKGNSIVQSEATNGQPACDDSLSTAAYISNVGGSAHGLSIRVCGGDCVKEGLKDHDDRPVGLQVGDLENFPDEVAGVHAFQTLRNGRLRVSHPLESQLGTEGLHRKDYASALTPLLRNFNGNTYDTSYTSPDGSRSGQSDVNLNVNSNSNLIGRPNESPNGSPNWNPKVHVRLQKLAPSDGQLWTQDFVGFDGLCSPEPGLLHGDLSGVSFSVSCAPPDAPHFVSPSSAEFIDSLSAQPGLVEGVGSSNREHSQQHPVSGRKSPHQHDMAASSLALLSSESHSRLFAGRVLSEALHGIDVSSSFSSSNFELGLLGNELSSLLLGNELSPLHVINDELAALQRQGSCSPFNTAPSSPTEASSSFSDSPFNSPSLRALNARLNQSRGRGMDSSEGAFTLVGDSCQSGTGTVSGEEERSHRQRDVSFVGRRDSDSSRGRRSKHRGLQEGWQTRGVGLWGGSLEGEGFWEGDDGGGSRVENGGSMVEECLSRGSEVRRLVQDREATLNVEGKGLEGRFARRGEGSEGESGGQGGGRARGGGGEVVGSVDGSSYGGGEGGGESTGESGVTNRSPIQLCSKTRTHVSSGAIKATPGGSNSGVTSISSSTPGTLGSRTEAAGMTHERFSKPSPLSDMAKDRGGASRMPGTSGKTLLNYSHMRDTILPKMLAWTPETVASSSDSDLESIHRSMELRLEGDTKAFLESPQWKTFMARLTKRDRFSETGHANVASEGAVTGEGGLRLGAGVAVQGGVPVAGGLSARGDVASQQDQASRSGQMHRSSKKDICQLETADSGHDLAGERRRSFTGKGLALADSKDAPGGGLIDEQVEAVNGLLYRAREALARLEKLQARISPNKSQGGVPTSA